MGSRDPLTSTPHFFFSKYEVNTNYLCVPLLSTVAHHSGESIINRGEIF